MQIVNTETFNSSNNANYNTIEKLFIYKFKGYLIEIKRDKRKDCYLSISKMGVLSPYERSKCTLGRNLFFTLKGAMSYAKKAIDTFVQMDEQQKQIK